MKTYPKRTAMTLVELLFALFIATTFVGMLAVMMARLLSSENSSTRHLEGMVSLAHLGEQLRRDAHAASGARIEPLDGQPRLLSFEQTSGRSVQYTLDDRGAERLEKRADQVVSRERFTLAEMRCLAWQDDIASSHRVALVVGRLGRQGDDPAAVISKFTIAAALPSVAMQVQP